MGIGLRRIGDPAAASDVRSSRCSCYVPAVNVFTTGSREKQTAPGSFASGSADILWNAPATLFPASEADQLMTDIVDRAVRSQMMAGIGGRDTKPELVLRRALHARGFRYRLHDRKLPGTPDLVFPRLRAVCFVHGCFWHRHAGCPYTTDPATRPEFWQAKFRANVERDRRAREILLETGWRVAVVWECALRGDRAEPISSQLDQWLRSTSKDFETELYS